MILEEYPNLVIGFSEKRDGSMKASLENQERFFKRLGIVKVVRAELVHKNKVELVSRKDTLIKGTDGLVTKDKNVFLAITVADCLPVFLYNFEKEIIGLIHAGWRGLALNIIEKAIEKTGKEVAAFIGSGISQCHFEVKEDVLNNFRPYLKEAQKGSYLDLKKIAQLQLMDLGVLEKNIEVSPECTYCLKDKYFSHRREGLSNTMIAVFGRR